jgi:hypothetical protein
VSCFRNIGHEAKILNDLRKLKLKGVVRILGLDPYQHLPHFIIMKYEGEKLSNYMKNTNYETRKLLIPHIMEAMI